MAEYGVPLTYEGSISVTSNALTTWQGDDDPATFLTLDGISLWQALPLGDFTALADQITGFRVEVDVSAGASPALDWGWNVQQSGESLVAIFDLVLDLPGPGTHTFAGPAPAYTGGTPPADPWAYVTAAMTEDPSNLTSVMSLQQGGTETSVTMTAFRLILLTADAEVRVTRQFPRDDPYGLGSAPRIYPPPRSGRVVGGHM